jgi:hypothetical protein
MKGVTVKKLFLILGGMLIVVGLLACSKNSASPNQPAANVRFLISATPSGGVILAKMNADGATADSIVITQATIILKRIKFLQHADSVTVDSVITDQEEQQHESDEGINFMGPFVVILNDTTPINLGDRFVPPGVYDGIEFKLHKLRTEDQSEHPIPDSLRTYSLVVTGNVKVGATWKPFVYKSDIDEEFKVKGQFTVTSQTSLVPFSLTFDLGTWFREGGQPSGLILDPTDPLNYDAIRHAIKSSIEGQTHGGEDHDADGHPDDETPHGD